MTAPSTPLLDYSWTLPFIPDRFELKLLDEKGARQQFAVIKRLFRAADELICATDAGREGELIFRYILELTGATAKPARRLCLNSLTAGAIRDAFRRLRPLADYDALYAAARCRSQADRVVGLNATRYYTVRHRDAGGRLWSVGRVQTPVLAMIVRRDDEIRAFTPEPFWELLTLYRKVTFKATGDRFTREEAARAVLDRVLGHPFVVRAVDRKEERELPPQLYDLTDLQHLTYFVEGQTHDIHEVGDFDDNLQAEFTASKHARNLAVLTLGPTIDFVGDHES